MGTTASTAQQTAVSGPPFEGLQGGMEDHHSLSIHSFQAAGPHNSRAKSIITNKVAPVVITYNCKEEFQIHDEVLKAHYTVGRISESTQEHYLVQGRYFMVRDVSGKMDVLNTTGSCGAPNFRQARGGQAVFGMGQPSLAGFQRLLQKLQGDGHKECIFFCVREEPVLFLRLDDDFVSYTPRDKQRLRENLRALSPGARPESLELAIRKEIHDFAQLGEGTYHVYHDIEHFRDEPRSVRIQSEDDIHVTEEVYKRPIFLLPSYRYHRLPLPEAGAPLEAQFDAFIGFLRESPSLLPLRDPSGTPPALVFSCQTGIGRTNLGMVLGTLVLSHCRRPARRPEAAPSPPDARPSEHSEVVQSFICMVPKGKQIVEEVDHSLAACSELHNLKEAVSEKLEGPGGDRPQGNGGPEPQQQKTLQSLERYFYLIAFNYYLHEQYPLAFALSFSRWMCGHPELYRLQVKVSVKEPAVLGEPAAKEAWVLVADEPFSPDVLSTAREMDVANFRRVAKSPWHGPACGGREGAPRGAGVPQGSPPPPGLGALPLPLQEEHGRELDQPRGKGSPSEGPVASPAGGVRPAKAAKGQSRKAPGRRSLAPFPRPPGKGGGGNGAPASPFPPPRWGGGGAALLGVCCPLLDTRRPDSLRSKPEAARGLGGGGACRAPAWLSPASLRGEGVGRSWAATPSWRSQAPPELGGRGAFPGCLTPGKRGRSRAASLEGGEGAFLGCHAQLAFPDSSRTGGKGAFPGCLAGGEGRCSRDALLRGPCVMHDFERLLQAVKEALAKEPSTGFVFSCLSGQGRTTTAMVVAVLTLWHITAFPEMGEEEIVSVPDAKYTKGEFEVVMKVVQLLPDGHRIKKEVDMALDTVSETMTPMHYHLREIIICTYRQGKTAKEEQEARTLYLRSLQYLERYIFLILFNAYLHLEKPGSWQRPFSVWMLEVAAKAGVYEILNHLGFTEFEAIEDTSLSRLRYRWRERTLSPGPFLGDFL
ncbi:paladin [Sarcophilus harrisii]|uniref:paladin n=1 Tax=Sarcophilus harrisii TaxID=9305 RepID=UPI0013020574|nr:paladin [Sarcophilus harrisii]